MYFSFLQIPAVLSNDCSLVYCEVIIEYATLTKYRRTNGYQILRMILFFFKCAYSKERNVSKRMNTILRVF